MYYGTVVPGELNSGRFLFSRNVNVPKFATKNFSKLLWDVQINFKLNFFLICRKWINQLHRPNIRLVLAYRKAFSSSTLIVKSSAAKIII